MLSNLSSLEKKSKEIKSLKKILQRTISKKYNSVMLSAVNQGIRYQLRVLDQVHKKIKKEINAYS